MKVGFPNLIGTVSASDGQLAQPFIELLIAFTVSNVRKSIKSGIGANRNSLVVFAVFKKGSRVRLR